MGWLHAFSVCNTFISEVRTLDIVPDSKFTTKRAVPSVEIARLLAAFPVVTVPIFLCCTKSYAVTFPELLSVA